MLEYLLGGAGVLAAAGSVGAICYYLRKVNTNLVGVKDKLASMHDDGNNKAGTVLLPVTKMDTKAECNTVLPLPMGAEMCNHSMDVVTNQVIRAPHEEKCVIILQCTKCGAIDKTIAVTSPPPKPPPPPPEPPPPRSECRHNWVKEKTITLQSAFEQMEELLKEQQKAAKANGTVYKPYNPKKKATSDTAVEEDVEKTVFDPSTAPPWMFQKKCIKERICSKCGEVDRVVTSNFDVDEEEGEKSE
jgi:hypothetical protein